MTKLNDKFTPVSGYETGYSTGYETGYKTGSAHSGSEQDAIDDPKRGFAAAREQIAEQYKKDEISEINETYSKQSVKVKLLAKVTQGNLTMFKSDVVSKDENLEKSIVPTISG